MTFSKGILAFRYFKVRMCVCMGGWGCGKILLRTFENFEVLFWETWEFSMIFFNPLYCFSIFRGFSNMLGELQSDFWEFF